MGWSKQAVGFGFATGIERGKEGNDEVGMISCQGRMGETDCFRSSEHVSGALWRSGSGVE